MENPGFTGPLSEVALRTMLQGTICSLFDGKRYGPWSKPLLVDEFGDYTNHVWGESQSMRGFTPLLTNRDSFFKGRTHLILNNAHVMSYGLFSHERGWFSVQSLKVHLAGGIPFHSANLSISVPQKNLFWPRCIWCTVRTGQYDNIIPYVYILLYTTDLLYVFVCALISETEPTDVWSSLQ